MYNTTTIPLIIWERYNQTCGSYIKNKWETSQEENKYIHVSVV